MNQQSVHGIDSRMLSSVANIIKQLQDDPNRAHDVAVLNKILRKQKKREAMVVSD